MLKPEDYLNHYKYQLWPILSKLEKERKRTLNSIAVVKFFNILSFGLILGFILLVQGLRIKLTHENIKAWISIYLVVLLFGPVYFLIINFIKQKFFDRESQDGFITRMKLRFMYVLVAIVIFAFIVLIEPVFSGFLLHNSLNIVFIGIIYLTAVVAILTSKLFPRFVDKYREKVKSEILPIIVSGYNPYYKFRPYSYLAPSEFHKSGLFNSFYISDYIGYDLISGETGFGKFDFCQLSLRIKSKSPNIISLPQKGGIPFEGIVYVADSNKKFSGSTLVYPDFARKKFGSLVGEALNRISFYSDKKLVMLEDTEFEEEFAVYSTDQVEARYILTPTMMEKLKFLKRRFNSEVYFSFVHHNICIIVNVGSDIFAPGIKSSLLNFGTFTHIYKSIGTLMEYTAYLSPETEAVG
jgi:hypothetical protein